MANEARHEPGPIGQGPQVMSTARRGRRACMIAAAAALSAAGAAWRHGAAAEPAPRDFSGRVDQGAGRAPLELVRLRLPESPPPWPLVIYSHGLGGSLDSGRLFTDAWCAAGWVAVHVLHPPTSSALLDAMQPALTRQRLNEALALNHVPGRCGAITRVLDHLLANGAAGAEPGTRPAAGHGFGRWLDRRHVVIAGHSYGALTAMALAGRDLRPSLRDARFSAAIALSPGVGSLAAGRSMATVAVPMWCATGSLDAFVEIGHAPAHVRAGVPLAQRLAVFEGLPRGAKRLLFVNGADHMSFAGEAEPGPAFGRAPGWSAAGESRRQALVVQASTEFLRALREGRFPVQPPAGRVELEEGYLLDG